MQYFEVVLAKSRSSRNLFTYHFESNIEPGQLVFVPFGRQKLPAIALKSVKKPNFKTKSIAHLTDTILPNKSLELLRWLLEYMPDDYASISSLFIPPNLNVKSHEKSIKSLEGLNIAEPKLTIDQKHAIDEITKDESGKIILRGDTGTGKTLVFTKIIQDSLKKNNSVVVITPEIGLTPQLALDIQRYTKAKIVISHSELGPAEKKRIWQHALNSDEPTVFIGPRSTLFLPFKSLGLVVIDEFHDQSLKQNNSPRYSSLHVASKLAKIHQAKLILSSATPNVSDLYQLKKSGFSEITMTQLPVSNLPAQGIIVDINNRDNFTKDKYLSDFAIEEISSSLNNNQQIAILLNRRGTARVVKCEKCDWHAECSKCGLNLTYHGDSFTLICHSCGLKQKVPSKCPICFNLEIIYTSIGTKALEENMKKLFPKATIARFDSDSLASEKLHKNIEAIKEGKINILIGTQVISKGLDLPKLNLAIAINADTSLYLPDFSSEERLFQQMYQFTGRVGRGHQESKYIIQTSNPDTALIESVLTRDYESFFNNELHKRKIYHYPPFRYMCLLKITKSSVNSVVNVTTDLARKLNLNPKLEILGPSPSFYEKSAKGYTWQIIIKSPSRIEILNELNKLNIEAVIDIDPISLL